MNIYIYVIIIILNKIPLSIENLKNEIFIKYKYRYPHINKIFLYFLI